MNNIINILKEKKSIPLDQFISIALYDKKFGYYMKKNPFGKNGDFITAPLISNLFGEMLAIWCVSFWEGGGFYYIAFNFKSFWRNDSNMVCRLLGTYGKTKKNFIS